MAAIIEPRTSSLPAVHRPSPAPRHLSAVSGPVVAVERIPVEPPLLDRSAIVGMAAVVVLAVIVAFGIGLGAFGGLVPSPGADPIPAAEAEVVVVESGDSVWSIARSLQPEGDLRPLVHRIVQANGSAPLQPGQKLVVPA